MQDFPECLQAGRRLADDVRFCLSPAITGVREVTSTQCGNCQIRHLSVDDEEMQAWPACAYLQDNEQTTAPVRKCCHPAHGLVSPADCLRCTDQLFRSITPTTPPDRVCEFTKLPAMPQPEGWWSWDNVVAGQRLAARECIANCPSFPERRFRGQGIAIIGGGKYTVSAYVTARVIRHLGCQLPIELWHLADEISPPMAALFAELGVACRDADAEVAQHPFRFLRGHYWRGWQLKAYAILHSSFRECLMLDADCYPVRDPAELFAARSYRERGAVIWPDMGPSGNLLPAHSWEVFEAVPSGDLPAESGQLLIHKEWCWRELSLAAHYNAQADFTYRWLYGDKDTFPIAWRRLGRDYARLWPIAERIPDLGFLQLDEDGQILFVHRCHDKFRLHDVQAFDTTWQQGTHNRVFLRAPLELFCFSVLEELSERLRLSPGDGRSHEPLLAAK